MNASSVPRASIPASTAKPSVPWRVESNFLVACMDSFPSAGHDGDAAAKRRAVARSAAGAGVERVDVLDEVADDVALVLDGVVALVLARAAVPAGEVERGEADDGKACVAAAGERAERRQDELDDAGVAGRDVRVARPVVGGRAAAV